MIGVLPFLNKILNQKRNGDLMSNTYWGDWDYIDWANDQSCSSHYDAWFQNICDLEDEDGEDEDDIR